MHPIGSAFKVNPLGIGHRFFLFANDYATRNSSSASITVRSPCLALYMGITRHGEYIFLVNDTFVTENPKHVDACWEIITTASDKYSEG